MAIRGQLWEWTALLTHLREAAAGRGRLERPLRLPVCWQQDGIYAVQELTADDELLIVRKCTKAVMKLPISEFDEIPKADDTFTILDNHSELYASVAVAGKEQATVCIGSLFHHHMVKKRAAIADGSTQETPSSSKYRRSDSFTSSMEGSVEKNLA